MYRGFVSVMLLTVASLLSESGAAGPARVPNTGATTQALGTLPLRFEENRGQTGDDVLFSSRGPGYALFLTRTSAVISLPSPANFNHRDELAIRPDIHRRKAERPGSHLIMKLVGAAPTSLPYGLEPLPGRVNYLRGRSPSQWITDVETYRKVRYDQVYAGIDLVYYGNGGELEYDFLVAPGADPRKIELQIGGASRVEIQPGGAVALHAGDGQIALRAPVIYQLDDDGARAPVAGRWLLKDGDRLGFSVGNYDLARTLVIDPVLSYASYLGASGSEDGLDNMGVVVDADGNIIITGTTDSADFPLASEPQSQMGGLADAFVTKLDPSGSKIIYSTYLGGAGLDSGQAIDVDPAGNAYITGFTESADFPLSAPLQETNEGFDAFLTKLDPNGAIEYSTYIGGSAYDFGLGIDVDETGQAYIAGDTRSSDMPVVNAYQPSFGGDPFDAWLGKIDSSGQTILYLTYLGGESMDSGQDVEVNADGYAHLAGFTLSQDFPTENAYQSEMKGNVDGFLAKFLPGGDGVVYSTMIGGAMMDRAMGVDLDAFDNAFIAGDTFSEDFPNVESPEPYVGFSDAYIAKFGPSGTLDLTSFHGGGVSDVALGLAVDGSGNAHITGMTFSHTMPTIRAFQDEIAGSVDAFVATLEASGGNRMFSSFLGGSDLDRGLGIDADAAGNIYVVGDTFSSDFPTVDPYQPALDGTRDAFIVKVSPAQLIVGDESLRSTQVVAGMVTPVAMAFVGANEVLVLESGGRIRRVLDGVLDPEPLLELPADETLGGRPHGMVVHPEFPTVPWVYLYFTEHDQGVPPMPLANRVYRYTWSNGELTLPQLLVDLPLGPAAGEAGGTIAFGPDGMLYVTNGDAGTGSVLQNVAGGAIADDTSVVMRMDENGIAAAGNPFVSAGMENVYAYGIRSSSALAFDPVSADLWLADNGRTEYDELNLVHPGTNGGWQLLVGPEARSTQDADDLVSIDGAAYRDPVFSWLEPVNVTAMTFLTTDKVGDHYENHLVVGDGINGILYLLKPRVARDGFRFLGPDLADGVADDKSELAETVLGTGFGVITDLEVGPDGGLYVLSAGLGSIFRVAWDADVDLRLSSDKQVQQGGPLMLTLSLENTTDAIQEIGLVLSIRLPDGVEVPFAGPVSLALAPGSVNVAELAVPIETNQPLGEWVMNGTVFKDGQSFVDFSATAFEVIP